MTFGQDEHVVAVDVHWVAYWSVVVEDDADGAVGAEVVDVPFGGEGVVVVGGGGLGAE